MVTNESHHPTENLLVFPAGASGHFLAGLFTDRSVGLDNNIEYNYKGNFYKLHIVHLSQLADTTTGASQDKDYSIDKFIQIAQVYKDSNVLILHPDVDWYIYILWLMKTKNDTNDTIESVAESKFVSADNTNQHYKHYDIFSETLKQQGINVLDVNYSDLFIKNKTSVVEKCCDFFNATLDIDSVVDKINTYTNDQINSINNFVRLDRSEI